MGDWSDDESTPVAKKPATSGGGDDWEEDEKPAVARDSGSGRGGRGGGRGGYSGGNFTSNDDDEGGFNRGGGFRGRGGRGGGGRGGRDDGGSREGDWICSGCQNSNFASRTSCRQCNAAKDGSADGGAAKEPDWICSGCENSNFANRRQCRSCNQAKDGSGDGAPKEPDWICTGCENSNFASRRQCRNCNQVKEGAEGGADGEKKRELYIPPAPTENEEEMFGGGISAGINFNKFDKIEVKVSSTDCKEISPIEDFAKSGLRDFLIENVKRSGYVKPTPIQKYAIPIILSGRDLMGCAQTGSGKTAAFILPILHAIMSDTESTVGQPQCLIVAPTRELVIQIFDEARKFANRSYVKIAIAYGGTASRHQSENISKGCHVLVATPGRLMDFVEKALVTFEQLKFLVLDEADRMLDMGFKEKIHQIANHETLDKEKVQTMMFSATFPNEIQRLAATYLRNYMFLVVGIVGGASTDVEQQVLEVTKFKKRSTLGEILKEYMDNAEEDRILVFVETKKTADFLASFMSETKISSTSIHGDREQREREEALRDFRTGKRKVLVATSVAARGLDIKGVTHVINYDLPKDIQDYVHRIGRTGRVGNRGKATSFYDPEHDGNIASELARILKESNQPVPEFLGEAGEGEAASAFGGTDVRSSAKAVAKSNDEEDW